MVRATAWETWVSPTPTGPGRAGHRLLWATTVHREIGDRPGEGIAQSNLGCLRRLGPGRASDRLLRASTGYCREIGDRRGEEYVLGNLGNAHALLGQTVQAIGFYERALVIAREIGDQRGEGIHLGNLDVVHAVQGQSEIPLNFVRSGD